MNTADVMADLAAALSTIDGLRVHPYEVESITPPAALVDEPDTIEYDETFGRGCDRGTFTVLVAVGRADARSASLALAPYRAGSGAQSVKAAIDRYVSTAYDTARVVSAERGYTSFAGVDYLCAKFTVDIYGKGA